MTYQKWYRWIGVFLVAAGLLSLLVILLTMGVALAEEVTIGNTDDVLPGSVQLVTQSADGNGVYADHFAQSMAEDGSFIFTSKATNLVAPPTTAGEERFYFFDNATKTVTVLPSFGTDGSLSGQITPGKEWILLGSFDYTLQVTKLFLYNTATTELTAVTKADGTLINPAATDFTADGNIVAISTLQKLDPADANSKHDLYLWNRDTKAIQLASTIANSSSASGIERPVGISDDGVYVSYIGTGANFSTCGTRTHDVYRKNVATGEAICVTQGVDDSDGEYFNAMQMSSDGTVFLANGLITVGVNPQLTAIYLVNLNNGTTPIILFNQSELNALNFFRLTADGKQVIYSNGIYTDPNNLRKFCTYEIATATHSCTTRPEGTQQGDLKTISPTGRYSVIWSWDHSWIGSTADNLKPNGDRSEDLFIWGRQGVNNAISGKVTGDDGTTGLANVVLTNGSREKYITDASGNYTMPYLNAGQTYVITPTLSGKTFYPANKTVTAPSGNVDFGTQQKFTISGRVIDKDGKGIANAVIQTNIASFVTDANGYYSIDGFDAGTYILTPTVPGLAFNPPNQSLTVPLNQSGVDFKQQCESPNTKFNVCDLEIGDILLYRGNFAITASPKFLLARLGVGTYWYHSAIYVGNGQITEAIGANYDAVDQVRTMYVVESRWWEGESSYDWSVIRPRASEGEKLLVANYALQKANQTNPPVLYLPVGDEVPVWDIPKIFVSNRESENPVYCSQLIWKAYKLVGLDLEDNAGLLTSIPYLRDIITSDDLYFTAIGSQLQSDVVQENPDVFFDNRAFFRVLSPVDMILTDSLGRRVGHDPRTGETFSEIPEAGYTGPDAEPETITIMNNSAITLSLTLIGTGDGEYTLETGVISTTKVLTDTFTTFTQLNQQHIYEVVTNPTESGDLVRDVTPVVDDRKLFLPLVMR